MSGPALQAEVLDDPLTLWVTAGVALAFAAIHFGAPLLRRLFEPERPWLASAAGGMAVAFAIIILLPELEYVHASVGDVVYPLVLAGLVGFYVAELGLLRRRAVPAGGGSAALSTHDGAGASVHLAISWLYTFGLVYALPDQVHEHAVVVLMTSVAIGLHLAYKDWLIVAHHPAVYRRMGRYLLATSPIAAFGATLVAGPSEMVSDLILALIAGYMLQNVFRNEMPESRTSQPLAFAAGALAVGGPITLALYLV